MEAWLPSPLSERGRPRPQSRAQARLALALAFSHKGRGDPGSAGVPPAEPRASAARLRPSLLPTIPARFPRHSRPLPPSFPLLPPSFPRNRESRGLQPSPPSETKPEPRPSPPLRAGRPRSRGCRRPCRRLCGRDARAPGDAAALAAASVKAGRPRSRGCPSPAIPASLPLPFPRLCPCHSRVSAPPFPPSPRHSRESGNPEARILSESGFAGL